MILQMENNIYWLRFQITVFNPFPLKILSHERVSYIMLSLFDMVIAYIACIRQSID